MTNLTDRYVWAAIRTESQKNRTELEQELRERIGDETDALIEAGRSPADAEREALTNLGDPIVLAAGYVGRPLQLIGPRYYAMWMRLLKLVLAFSLPFTALGVAIGHAVAGASVGGVIGAVIGITLTVAVHICFWVTVVFAVIERMPAKDQVDLKWTLDMLPELPDPGKASRPTELIATLLMLGLVAAAVIWQSFGVIWVDGERQPIPLLDTALWSFWIPVFFVLLALEAVFAVVVYRRGWSWGLAGANLALNVAAVVPFLLLFVNGALLHPDFVEAIGWPWGEAGPVVATVIIVVVIGGAVWDVVEGYMRAARYRGGRPDGALCAPVGSPSSTR
jgi:hypothetical protein